MTHTSTLAECLSMLSRRESIETMITDFRDEETRKVWLGEFSRRLPNQIQEFSDFCKHGWFGRFQHAIQSAQHSERQYHLPYSDCL